MLTDFDFSFRDLAISSATKTEMRHKLGVDAFSLVDDDVNLYAGANVIEYFQNKWCDMHCASNLNFSVAKQIAQNIYRMHSDIKHLDSCLIKLNDQLLQAQTQIETELNSVEQELGRSIVLFGKFEEAITDLTKESSRQDYLERRQESMFKLDQLLKRRQEELMLYDAQLNARRQKQHLEIVKREQKLLRERQLVFQQAFEEELQMYKQNGQVNFSANAKNVQPAAAAAADFKLEDISLDIEIEEVDALERFLQEDS